MNLIFFALVAIAILATIISFVHQGWTTGDWAAAASVPDAVGKALLDDAKKAVELSIGLVGAISLFLGLMKVVEEAGGLRFAARLIRPLLVRLFPDVPADHPAMGAIIMNLAANAIGLGNAATPFGLKAMKELETLNKAPGTATDAMVRFLAINTSGVAILPTGIIGLRALKNSVDPAAIFPTTIFATCMSTTVAVIASFTLARLPVFRRPPAQEEADAAVRESATPGSLMDLLPVVLVANLIAGLVTAVYLLGTVASAWIMPLLIFGMLTVGVVARVKVYEVFVAGAREGFQMAIQIIPYLIAILVAVGMIRASGALNQFVSLVGPFTEALGLPAEVLPLALLRPLSGSGSFALTAELVDTHGPDSLIGQLACTINGSTETTFYVLAVYFGSIGISRSRHAVPAGLLADFAGLVGSVLAVRLLLG